MPYLATRAAKDRNGRKSKSLSVAGAAYPALIKSALLPSNTFRMGLQAPQKPDRVAK